MRIAEVGTTVNRYYDTYSWSDTLHKTSRECSNVTGCEHQRDTRFILLTT